MKIDIYTSAINGSKYLSVAKGIKIEELELPADFDADLLSLSPFRTRLELIEGKPHNALDQDDVIKQIEANGYAVHAAKQPITLTLAK
ncbi:MAG: hypothetical protein HRU20_31305 [Pseudomonadales bacterium]|nr:hypothetical protein [Pseudomonadales bacterium]